jgi:hypothetical protein
MCVLSGYFCPPGTGELTVSIACSNATVYCPEGSSSPNDTSPGFYAIATRPGLYFNQSECPRGSYCIAGVAQLCGEGRYGATTRLNSSNCTDECTAGYYCPLGSTSATESTCGSVAVYCPQVRATSYHIACAGKR